MDVPVVFLDTEDATLLGASQALGIGAVRVVDGEADDRFETLVGPQVPIEPEATAIHDIEIETAVHHRALPDAVSCWKVLEACLDRLPAEPPPTTAKLLAYCSPPVSIASSAPRAPRIAPRLRPIEEALRTRGRITVLYGEAEELSRLSVLPRILFESRRRGYMEAECTRSGLLKIYRLDRVRRILETA